MATEIDERVGDFLARRGPAEGSVEAHPELAPAAAALDALWWREAEAVLVRAVRVRPDALEVPPADRLLLDLGVLDVRLLADGGDLRPALVAELALAGPPGQFYLSEWLARRYRQFLLYGGMSEPEGSTLNASRIIRDMRWRLYARMAPLLRNLPGFSPQHIDLFLGGRIDETLYAMSLDLEQRPDPHLAEQRLQLEEIRTRLLTRARERARTGEDLALFDELRELDRQAVLRRRPAPAAPPSPRAVAPREREEFLQSEVRYVRSVLWLGVTGSGLARTRSVLLSPQPRITKPEIAPVLAQVRACDPTLPELSSILLAPAIGAGFYEWDRDTLFLPILPTRSAEESVVSALARYRMLLDRFQGEGGLLRDYESAVGGDDPHAGFVKDYKAWILGVGRGFRGALDPARLAFFRERIGPQPASLFAPREWSSLTPEEREGAVRQSRSRIARAEGRSDDHYRLAVAAADQQQFAPAIHELQQALRLNPADARALLALGHLSARQGTLDEARKKFAECMALAHGTLWSVYAADEMQKLA